MNQTDQKIYIIGAGISGLIAAINLEKKGYTPVILEASSSIGGRIKTDIVKGYQLDHGFQVLLESYPKAKQYLDYKKLELQSFLPGATIYKNRNSQTIGDPTRSLKMLIPTMSSSIGTLGDKVKILKLNKSLKKKTLEDIFKEEEKTTLKYLQDKGFSNAMIIDFFKPFFSGIFLEPSLETSSRMFEFVYKMFGTGMATLPKAGIGAIPKQLQEQLVSTQIRLNTAVKEVSGQTVTLESGEVLESDYIIIATEVSHIVPNLRGQETAWKSCVNLYFEVDAPKDRKPLIGLVADENTRINNIFYHNTLETATTGGKSLLSVTVVADNDLSIEALKAMVTSELSTYCGINGATFLKSYVIRKALPSLSNLRNDCAPSETQLTNNIFLAGDHLLNGSLNAAMVSGERAAEGVIEKIEGLLK